jgi:hypothetical protein
METITGEDATKPEILRVTQQVPGFAISGAS